MSSIKSKNRKIVFWFLLGLLIVILIETLSYVTIWVSRSLFGIEIRRTRDIFHEQSDMIKTFLEPGRLESFDSILGFRYRANFKSDRTQTNSQGLRSTRVYSPVADSGMIRVAAFGNSFVYCNEVANKDSWSALIEAIFPHIEVLNYGVGGYGTDQAYLRFMIEGSKLSPQIVIIGFAPVNLRRVVNVYRRFISDREIPLVKPRFTISESRLELIANPLLQIKDYEKYINHSKRIIELGENDLWYEPVIYENPFYDYSSTARLLSTLWVRVYNRYLDPDRLLVNDIFNTSSTAFKIQTAIFEKFVDEIKVSQMIPLIVIFPDKDTIIHGWQGRKKIYVPLVNFFRAKNLDFVDLIDAFLAHDVTNDIEQWFMSGGHYSPKGNMIVALWLGKQIQARLAK